MESRRAVAATFAATSGASAFLLFVVQPMLARMVLPGLGGSASVWITCSLFFQVALLAGYGYAHVLRGRLTPRGQVAVHGLLFLAALACLPLDLRATPVDAGSADPRMWLLGMLAVRAGLPLLAISATAPLLQGWFTRTGAADPYPLYVASNLGSLAALGLLPFAIEPALGLAGQGKFWSLGFAILGVGLAISAALAVGGNDKPERPRSFSPSASDFRKWTALAFVPSSLLLGVTRHLTTDIAPMPLLWVVPLGLYLLSFATTFAARPWPSVESAGRWYGRSLMVLVPALISGTAWLIWLPWHLLAFALAAWLCHGRLARLRPPAEGLTAFYLAIALGGACGGVFNALIAPTIFDRVVEYPLMLVAAALAVPGAWATRPSWREIALPSAVFGLLAPVLADVGGLAESLPGVIAVILGAGLAVLGATRACRRPREFAGLMAALLLAGGLSAGKGGRVVHRERNFYGTIAIKDDAAARVRRLVHGTTVHGQQSLDPARRREPMVYYAPEGPCGGIMAAFREADAPRRVAVVGLGAGSMAVYARPDEDWTFLEIDPAMARIAGNPRWFTFLADSPARSMRVVAGDARLTLADAPDGSLGLLVLDAFSSDAPPVHLLTVEAFALYRRKLAPGGLLAVNLTNRYLDLEGVVALSAEANGLGGLVRFDRADERESGRFGSIWALLADRPIDEPGAGWRSIARGSATAWTDDASDLLRPLASRLFGRRPATP